MSNASSGILKYSDQKLPVWYIVHSLNRLVFNRLFKTLCINLFFSICKADTICNILNEPINMYLVSWFSSINNPYFKTFSCLISVFI